jgi:transcription elongation factor GreA
MKGECRCARVDQAWADVEGGAGAVVDAPPHLHGHRDRDGACHGVDDAAGAVFVLEERGTGTRLRHLLHRAAEVDVDEVGSGVLDHARRLGHRRRLAAEDLDRERALVRRDPQVAERALVPVREPGAAHHLRADEARAEPATLPAEGLNAHAGHRREHDSCRDLDVADAPGGAKIYLHRGGNPSREGRSSTLDAGCTMTRLTVPQGAPHCVFSGGLEAGLAKEVILTSEGLERLKEDIEHLSTVKRREVAERIKLAREFGDIAENSEYDDAKNEQAMLEHRIALLEDRLAHARVIGADEISSDVVSVGVKVRLRDLDANETVEYTIVGSAEANPAEHRLSNESPVGKAIIGRKKGETVEVSVPRGSLKFKIMDIKAA